MFCFVLFFWCLDWTQDLALAKHMPYHWAMVQKNHNFCHFSYNGKVLNILIPYKPSSLLYYLLLVISILNIFLNLEEEHYFCLSTTFLSSFLCFHLRSFFLCLNQLHLFDSGYVYGLFFVCFCFFFVTIFCYFQWAQNS